MVVTVTKYRAEDGSEHSSLEEAESHDFYLKVRGVLRYEAGPNYSGGYDGPMPVYEPDLRTLCAYRDKVRHLFLDIEPPAPETVVRTETKFVRKWPHWSAWVSLILLGAAVGHFAIG